MKTKKPEIFPYLTEYKAAYGGRYGADIWAKSLREARHLAKKRHFGEKVLGKGVAMKTTPASKVLNSHTHVMKKVHALCWLGFLATKSRVASAYDFFGDENGVLHQYAHYVITPRSERGQSWRSFIKLVKRIERKIPGYPPC